VKRRVRFYVWSAASAAIPHVGGVVLVWIVAKLLIPMILQRGVTGIVGVIGLGLTVVVARKLYLRSKIWQLALDARGRRFLGSPAIGASDERAPVLYLRPFTADRETIGVSNETANTGIGSGQTEEECLALAFAVFGPLHAIGQPKERVQPLGANRTYLAGDDWQAAVDALLHEASVVLIGAGPGKGVLWEVDRAIETVDPARLVIAVPRSRTIYERFRRDTFLLLPKDLPSHPQPSRHYRRCYYQGLMYFTPDWTPGFVPFVPPASTARGGRRLTGAIVRALRQIAELPTFGGPVAVSWDVLEQVYDDWY
jgi:hypothetical protein